MYNLRFHVQNNKITKCDYKPIAPKGELDISYYNVLSLPQKRLFDIYNELRKNDIKRTVSQSPKFTIYVFKVPDKMFKDIREQADQIQKEKTIEKAPEIEKVEVEVVNTKFKQKKKRKIKLNRDPKFVRRRVIASLVTIVTLSGLIFGSIKVANAVNKEPKEPEDNTPSIVAIEEDEKHLDDDIIIDDDKVIITDNPDMHNLVDHITESIQENVDYTVSIETDNGVTSSKYINCYNNYYEIIEKYANIYGIDPKYALAIATQERGTHSEVVEGDGGLGLFQIQIRGGWNWEGKDVVAYNFDTDSWETYTIYEKNIKELENNVKAAMMYIQTCLRDWDYNLPFATQEYNMGPGATRSLLHDASDYLNIPYEKLIEEGSTRYVEYIESVDRSLIPAGDANYLKNVFQYLEDGVILSFITPDFENLFIRFDNQNVHIFIL